MKRLALALALFAILTHVCVFCEQPAVVLDSHPSSFVESVFFDKFTGQLLILEQADGHQALHFKQKWLNGKTYNITKDIHGKQLTEFWRPAKIAGTFATVFGVATPVICNKGYIYVVANSDTVISQYVGFSSEGCLQLDQERLLVYTWNTVAVFQISDVSKQNLFQPMSSISAYLSVFTQYLIFPGASRFAVSPSGDKVFIYDFKQSGRLITVLNTRDLSTSQIQFSFDSWMIHNAILDTHHNKAYIFLDGVDKSSIIWNIHQVLLTVDLQSGAIIRTINIDKQNEVGVSFLNWVNLQISPDGQNVIGEAADNLVQFNLNTFETCLIGAFSKVNPNRTESYIVAYHQAEGKFTIDWATNTVYYARAADAFGTYRSWGKLADSDLTNHQVLKAQLPLSKNLPSNCYACAYAFRFKEYLDSVYEEETCQDFSLRGDANDKSLRKKMLKSSLLSTQQDQ